MRPPASTAARWALVAMALHGGLMGLLAAHYGGPEWFLHLGHNNSPNLAFARRVLGADVVVPHVDGHDGRYFWVQARDPLLLDARAEAKLLNRPVYRAQRLAYPLVAAPWRAFGERGLLWGMLGTNLVVVGAGAFVAALLALELGGPARASLAFALNPAVIIASIGDLSDGMALAALLLALLLLARRRLGWALAAAAVAVLAKEPMLLGLGGVALLSRQFPRRHRVLLVAVPCAVAVAWAVYIRWRLGWPATSIQEFAGPFVGYVDAWRRGWAPVGNWGDAAAALALVPVAALIVVRWWRSRSFLLDAALPFAVLVPFLSSQVLDILLNSTRALGPAFTLLGLDLYCPKSRLQASGVNRGDPGALR